MSLQATSLAYATISSLVRKVTKWSIPIEVHMSYPSIWVRLFHCSGFEKHRRSLVWPKRNSLPSTQSKIYREMITKIKTSLNLLTISYCRAVVSISSARTRVIFCISSTIGTLAIWCWIRAHSGTADCLIAKVVGTRVAWCYPCCPASINWRSW